MPRPPEPVVKKHKSIVRQLHADGGIIEEKYKPNPTIAAIVRRCRGGGMPVKKIAKIVGVSAGTLEKYYSDDVDEGAQNLIVSITEKMAEIALDTGNKQCVVAGKFVLSRLAPDVFAERSEHQFLDRNGNLADPNAPGTLDPYNMTDEQREALKKALASVLKDAVDEAADHKLNRDAIEVEALEFDGDVVPYEEVERS